MSGGGRGGKVTGEEEKGKTFGEALAGTHDYARAFIAKCLTRYVCTIPDSQLLSLKVIRSTMFVLSRRTPVFSGRTQEVLLPPSLAFHEKN